MRYIIKDDIEEVLPEDWEEKVQAARNYVLRKISDADEKAIREGKDGDELEKEIDKARKTAITYKSDIWQYASQFFKKIVNGKCWYCESDETRSDMPVDHFRPKNSVAECSEHPGYWWLAFDWQNYRYSCTFCNSRRVDGENRTSGGKQDHFPIIEPPARAMTENDNWKSERPVLLDPLVEEDTLLLTFHENGYPREKNQNKESFEYIRAKQSIYFYHLDHRKAVVKRKKIAIEIRNHYNEVEKLEAQDNKTQAELDQIKYHRKEIIKKVRSKAPFCSAARVYLQRFKRVYWVNDILSRNI
jgi:uncharacterized protein (TIGR02646 family)